MSLPDTFAVMTDPFFYAVTIPAVLLLGISKNGFGAGFGSLAVPMMALAVTVPQAAAILMPLLFVMDVLGMAAVDDGLAVCVLFVRGGVLLDKRGYYWPGISLDEAPPLLE